jgi:acetyltransferase
MVTKEDLVYRQVVTLRDGARVLLRPLVPDDRQALLNFFLPISLEDRRYMRHFVADPELITAWAENVDYDKVFPLIAVVGDRIVGNATLHFYDGPARHRCELRIFMTKDFRHRGLGSKLIQGLVDIAKRRNIYLIEAQVVNDHVEVIKAMQKAGFVTVGNFEDYFMLPDGELRDVVILHQRLRKAEEEF